MNDPIKCFGSELVLAEVQNDPLKNYCPNPTCAIRGVVKFFKAL